MFSEKDSKSIPDKYFYPLILLLPILIIKFILFTRIYPNKYLLGDLSVHLPTLFFLKQYGFLGIVANWYEGTYVLLQSYPPGWFFFTYPIYLALKDIFITTFVSIILIYILGFIFILFLGKILNISKIKCIVFFTLFYANPLTINTVFDIGRIPDIFSWTIFILVLSLIFFYKDKPLNNKFYLMLTVAYSVLILAHIWVTILSSFLLLGFLFRRPLREWLYASLSVLAAAAITSFWWLRFIPVMLLKGNKEFFPAKDQFLILSSIISFNTIIIIALFVVFYYYWKSKNKSHKELCFFIPILIMAILVLSRIITLIPVFNKIPANPFNYFFLFMMLIYLFQIKLNVFSGLQQRLIPWVFLIITIISISLTFLHFNNVPIDYSKAELNFIDVMPNISGRSLFVGNIRASESDYGQFVWVIAYSAIYHNLTTPGGGYVHGSPIMDTQIEDLNNQLKLKNCDYFNNGIKTFNVQEVVSNDEFCQILTECGLKEKLRKENMCIMTPQI